jgi:hypothetical protein
MVMPALSSVVLCYIHHQRGTKTARFMALDGDGKVARAVRNSSVSI